MRPRRPSRRACSPPPSSPARRRLRADDAVDRQPVGRWKARTARRSRGREAAGLLDAERRLQGRDGVARRAGAQHARGRRLRAVLRQRSGPPSASTAPRTPPRTGATPATRRRIAANRAATARGARESAPGTPGRRVRSRRSRRVLPLLFTPTGLADGLALRAALRHRGGDSPRDPLMRIQLGPPLPATRRHRDSAGVQA